MHTNSTWHFSDNRAHWKTNAFSVTVRKPGVHCATVANCPVRATIPEEEARANALLIAAAPDMLRLLWSIKSHLGGMPLYAGTQLDMEDVTALESITRVLDQAITGRTE